MKLIKKLLRLLPIFLLLTYFISIIFNKNGYTDPRDLVSFLDIETGNFDVIVDSFTYLVPNKFLTWFNTNVNSNYLLQLSLSTLFYELYLSLAFLCFDFINMVFSWANKLMNKGGNLDD